jgi:peptidoglycan/LPS O-acetylase OafA/YrhL
MVRDIRSSAILVSGKRDHMTGKESKENRPLTSIRGVASLWVFGSHLELSLTSIGTPLWPALFYYGYAAVDIFFILSGFIITEVYGNIEFRQVAAFFVRRIFRIYPLHLFVLSVMVVLWLWVELRFHVRDPGQQLWTLPAEAALLQPYFYNRVIWNGPSWSVGVELLCYFLFPLAIYLMRHAHWVVFAALIVLLAYLERDIQLRYIGIAGFPAVDRALVGFALGMALRLLVRDIPFPPKVLASILEVSLAALAIALIFTRHVEWVPQVVGILIVMLYWNRGIVSRILSGNLIFFIGRISFSIYLLHSEMMVVVYGYMPPTHLPFGPRWNAIGWSVMLLLMVFVAATLTWTFIEEPGRRLGSRIARRMRKERAMPLDSDATTSLRGPA